ncbi:ABC transporter permease [Arcobacter arenosus]|uniref:ABC transporter permease subunit n=1 Tax=Arcobacter arenosus TaxID=2576037 RepID=A0A5R8Y1R1_9BACT|nr:ABC transporter permease subunit [Arcobacter arenosus]TLP38324.1 ABC transporter permease subunit [Arcobacter arenosus]
MLQTRLLSICAFIIIWQALSIVLASQVFPSSVDIGIKLFEHLVEGELLDDLKITLIRVVITFFITMIIGVFIGIIMGISKKIDDVFDFLLVLGLNIPALVVIVICYIWFGLTDFAALLAVIINKVPIVIVNIREGTRAIETKYMDLAKVYKVPKKQVFFKVFLPQIYPYMMASARLSLSLIWKIVLVVELLGRSDGIGFKISMFFQFFDITSILAYSLAFIFIVMFIEMAILKPLENKMLEWK